MNPAGARRLPAHLDALENPVRFRTLGCWQVTAAIASEPHDLRALIAETARASGSERQGRLADREGAGSLERQKLEGYF